MTVGLRRLVVVVMGMWFAGVPALVFAQNKPADAKDAKPALQAPAAPAPAAAAAKPAATEPAKPGAVAPAAEGKDAAAQKDAKDEETKLLKLTTPEGAFVKALTTRNALVRAIAVEEAKAKQTTDENALKEIQKNIEDGRRKLQAVSVAMEVIFGIGQRRDYDYDPVKSMVYLRVGTVEETFARAIRTRDVLRKFVADQQALKDAEKDEAKKADIDKKVQAGTKQYQLVAAALQIVYGIAPARNYLYNDKNSTLYLKISENELEKLKEQLAKLQQEREIKKDEAAKEPAKEPGKEPAKEPAKK